MGLALGGGTMQRCPGILTQLIYNEIVRHTFERIRGGWSEVGSFDVRGLFHEKAGIIAEFPLIGLVFLQDFGELLYFNVTFLDVGMIVGNLRGARD